MKQKHYTTKTIRIAQILDKWQVFHMFCINLIEKKIEQDYQINTFVQSTEMVWAETCLLKQKLGLS